MDRAQTDLAYREFLQLGLNEPLPDPSSLCYFRGRLGVDGFRKVFPSTHRERDKGQHGWIHRFPRKKCEACLLLGLCMKNPPHGYYGRKVRKNDYEPEYHRARQKVGTAAYRKARAEHPLLERKLGEMLNRHSGRRARYWGTAKVLTQELMAALATNVREVVRWFCARAVAAECGV
jgi:hypothetical protein